MTHYASMTTLRRSLSPDVARESAALFDDADADANERNAGSLGAMVQGAPLEHDEQCALFAWAAANEAAHPELRQLFSIPNGGKRPIRTAVRLKEEGLKSGVPDLMLAVARGHYHGLFIELKRTRNGRVQQAQDGWIIRLRYYGYIALICHGCEEAKQAIMAYLGQEG